jgi:tetratricopeptide (TPR) repeat protein
MHPTVFQLQAFGQCRLDYAPARRVLDHLRGGCGGCWAALLPHLIPWLDDDAAAEARATGPADAGPGLRAAYMQAARRAARAAARHRSPRPGGEAIRRVVRVLEAEGPSALGRLPRRLLGVPAVEALLRLCRRAPADPRLKLRLAEVAMDLAIGLRKGLPGVTAIRNLHFRACIELTHSYRVFGEQRWAQEQLNQAADDLLRGEHDQLLEAELIEHQAALLADQYRFNAALAGLAGVVSAYRSSGLPTELARSLVRCGAVFCYADRYETALDYFHRALGLVDGVRHPTIAAAALGGICETLFDSGRWGEAQSFFRRSRPLLDGCGSVLNQARFTRLEGRICDLAGDAAGAARAFASCRAVFASFGKSYVAGLTLLDQAAALERRGDFAAARTLVLEGTEMLLKQDPHQEAYAALMLLRATRRFAAARPALPLDRVIRFLDAAEFNPSVRLQSYLP